jgi:Arc/MetJ family transcription regulator
MRTNIVLNEALIQEAIQLTGVSTKRELVDMALRELIRSKKKKNLFDLAGEIDLFDGYDYKASRELRHGTD